LGNFPRIEIIFTCIDNGYSKLGSKSDSKYDELIKIKKLLNDDILTKEEYEVEKKKLLLRSK